MSITCKNKIVSECKTDSSGNADIEKPKVIEKTREINA
jgi:hypothetical protein